MSVEGGLAWSVVGHDEVDGTCLKFVKRVILYS